MSGWERQDRRGSTASHPGTRQGTTPLGMVISVGVKHVIDVFAPGNLWGKACDHVWVNAITKFTPTCESLPQTLIRHSLSSYYHHILSSLRAYTMPRIELRQMQGNSVPRKKSAKSDSAPVPGKAASSSSKSKKENLAKQLLAQSATGEESNSGSEEGSGSDSGLDENGENVSEEAMRKDKHRDRSKPASEDEDDVGMEYKGERRGPEKRKPQGRIKSKQVLAKKKKEPRALCQLRVLDVKDRYVPSPEMWHNEPPLWI